MLNIARDDGGGLCERESWSERGDERFYKRQVCMHETWYWCVLEKEASTPSKGAPSALQLMNWATWVTARVNQLGSILHAVTQVEKRFFVWGRDWRFLLDKTMIVAWKLGITASSLGSRSVFCSMNLLGSMIQFLKTLWHRGNSTNQSLNYLFILILQWAMLWNSHKLSKHAMLSLEASEDSSHKVHESFMDPSNR